MSIYDTCIYFLLCCPFVVFIAVVSFMFSCSVLLFAWKPAAALAAGAADHNNNTNIDNCVNLYYYYY